MEAAMAAQPGQLKGPVSAGNGAIAFQVLEQNKVSETEAAQNRHRKDHIAVLAANIQVAEHVVRNAPDEVSDPVQLSLFHLTPCM